MKIHFLGTCSGTEPMPNRHHTAIIIEVGDGLYWFDAGENCSYRAFLSGFDYSKIRALFISHPHIDHIGGLPLLLFNLAKLNWRKKLRVGDDNILKMYLPDFEFLEGLKKMVNFERMKKGTDFDAKELLIHDGVIFEDAVIKVSAIHNGHLGEDGTNGWHSYSFLIEAEGKKVVYSGDVKSPHDYDCFTDKGCDVLIMETGHHKVTDVCDYALEKKVKRLLFTHHGREILENQQAAQQIIDEKNVNATICYDGMTEIVEQEKKDEKNS